MSQIYTLEQAVGIARWLESELKPLGAHVALGGSTLHAGESKKDIDIIIYPRNERIALTRGQLGELVQKVVPGAVDPDNPDYPDNRFRLFADMNGVRIDFFIFTDAN